MTEEFRSEDRWRELMIQLLEETDFSRPNMDRIMTEVMDYLSSEIYLDQPTLTGMASVHTALAELIEAAAEGNTRNIHPLRGSLALELTRLRRLVRSAPRKTQAEPGP